MRIVADRDINAVSESFREFGDLVLLPGREIRRAHLLDAEVLLVRSITRVDPELLQGTSVRFVGSATSGMDHVDQVGLRSLGIAVADAAGSNAQSVAEYCIAALGCLAAEHGGGLQGARFAVVGAGHVGSRLAALLAQMGLDCVVVDPGLDRERRALLENLGCRLGTHAEAWSADVISLHVPLEKHGPFPTFHMLNGEQLQKLGRGTMLLNTSRGSVIDNLALVELLRNRADLRVVMDVWEGEPLPGRELTERISLATPHIAGYSVDAKARATQQLRAKLLRYAALRAAQDPQTGLQEEATVGRLSAEALAPGDDFCHALLSQVLPLEELDMQYRLSYLGARDPAAVFDGMRLLLARRRECAAYQVLDNGRLTDRQRRLIGLLGFRMLPPDDGGAQ